MTCDKEEFRKYMEEQKAEWEAKFKKQQQEKGRVKKRACLNYSMGLCKAPCMGYISKEEYKNTLTYEKNDDYFTDVFCFS